MTDIPNTVTMTSAADDSRYIVTGVPRYPDSALPRPRFHRRRSLSATRAPNVRFTDERVTINTGGMKFQTLRATLHRHPGTLLYDLSESSKFYDEQKQEFFFDRNATLFESILDFYRSGELHFSEGACPAAIRRELSFWRVPLGALDDCCWLRVREEEDLRKQRAHLREVVTQAKQVQEDTVEQLEDMPPADKTKVTKKLFEALHVSTLYPDLLLVRTALHGCWRELSLFLVVLFTSVFSFAIVIRVLEGGPDVAPNFLSALWWTLATMTTVGGATPQTYLGTLVGIVAVVLGVVAITLPLPLVTARLRNTRRLVEENARLDERETLEESEMFSAERRAREKLAEREGLHLTVRGRDPNKKKL